MKGKLFARDAVENRQQQLADRHGRDQGTTGEKDGFAEVLQDQCDATGAYDFFYPYLPGPMGRPGGGQVHKIDAGDDEDKNGDDDEQPYIDDPAAALHAVL